MSKQNNNAIKYWAEDDRPREKMLAKGIKSLSNTELLAIIIGSGTKNKSAVELAKEILTDNNNNLTCLSKLEINDLMKYKGIGKTKSINVMAAIEIGKRQLEEKANKSLIIENSKQVFDYLYSYVAGKSYEEFWILLLNRANKVIGNYQISVGGIGSTEVDPKKIFRIALDKKATGIILCHNHPSENIEPSTSDINLTKKLKEAGNTLDIIVMDHIIIGTNEYFSFADKGIL